MNQLKFFILGLLLCVSVNTFAQDTFEMDTLQWTGPAENRVNFVILGDGYLESELDDFADELPTIVGNIFTQEPYKSYRNFFNIIAVNVISNETGAALDPSTLIDNYFGSTYNFAGIDRLLVPTKSNKVFNVLGRQFPSYDQIIVVVNHTKYGGSGGQLATSSINTSAPEITLHEIGHSFSGLIDEYWAGPQYAREGKNMTQETDENIVIWRNWMNELGIGIYDHNSDPSWKRPHQSCKMRYLGSDFCAVCKEATVEVIHDLVNTIDEYFPKDMVLDLKNEDSLAFEMDLVMPEPNSLSVEWFLNDDLVRLDDAKIKIGKEEFLAGENTLEAFVLDETVFSRIDDESNRLNMVKWTIDKSGSTSIQASASNLNYHLFPNPAGNQLNVNLKSTYKGDISASVYNVSGQLLLQQDFSNNKTNQVDVRTLPSGNYVFKLNIGPKQLSKNFIKK